MEFDLSDLFDDESIESVDARLDFERYMAGLKARDAQVLYLFACGHTQEEIGAEVGVTDRQVRRILSNIRKKCPKEAEFWRVNSKGRN